VSARSESWSPPGNALRAAPAALVGIALLGSAWALLHVGFYAEGAIVDTPVYRSYGEAVLDGEVPYRDFAVEYPPAALPAFVLPSLAPASYDASFEALMLACGAAAVAFVALALAALDAPPARLYGAVVFMALAPLAVGSVILTRYDLWPAALCAAALAAFVSGRSRLGFGVLAVAVAAKVYPLVLLPLALLYAGRGPIVKGPGPGTGPPATRPRAVKEAAVGLGVFAAVLALLVVPFALVSPAGLTDSFERQAGRPLQIESLGSAFLLAANQLGVYTPAVVSSHGSQNLAGSVPDLLATVQTAVQALVIGSVWILFARSLRGSDEFLAAAAAAVVAFVAFGKVLSPQFLIWLLPLVPLVARRRGVAASALLALALVLTQLWFPSRYWEMVSLSPAGWLVLVRDLTLVALFATLLGAIRSRRAARRTA